MIVQFDTTLLDVHFAVAGSDVDTFNSMDASKRPGDSVQIIADDTDVLNNVVALNLFVAVAAGPTLTSVIRRYVVTLTSSINPIELNQQPTISVQLKDQSNVNVSQVATVTLNVDFGTLANATLVTNGSGFASTTYKPNKGASATISGTILGFLPGHVQIAINIPTTAAQQNWLESADIKDGAITGIKLGDGINIAPLPRSGFYAGMALDANSIHVDATHIYVNGFAGPGATNPQLSKITKLGVPVATCSYVNSNLTSGLDGIDGNGTDVWVASGNHLLQINKGTMTITNDYTVDPSGTIQSVTLDVANSAVWCFLKGGTTNPDKLLRINNGTGAVSAVIDLDTSPGGVVVNKKRGIIFGGEVYYNIDTSTSFAGWASVNQVTNAVTYGANPYGDPYSNVIAANADGIWFGGVAGVAIETSALWPSFAGLFPLGPEIVGIVYDLLYDGDHVWAITSELGSPPAITTPRYLRELYLEVDYDAIAMGQQAFLRVGRVIDVAPRQGNGLAVPNCLGYDANNLYVTSMTTTAPAGNSKENVIKFKYQ